mmetsp:Transcript_13305/g.28249  ORF Transcript_13305/g.28249 Transcript_13305/m.28249 type:complete len:538 (+) Transcript_13305:187-1800(+)
MFPREGMPTDTAHAWFSSDSRDQRPAIVREAVPACPGQSVRVPAPTRIPTLSPSSPGGHQGGRSLRRSDDLRGRNDQLLVDAAGEVLVEERAQLVVLALEADGVLQGVGAALEQEVVLLQLLVQPLPDAVPLLAHHARHALPVLLVLLRAPPQLQPLRRRRQPQRLPTLAGEGALLRLDEGAEPHDHVVGVHELHLDAVQGALRERSGQRVEGGPVHHPERLQDVLHLHHLPLLLRHRVQHALHLGVDQEARLVAEEVGELLEAGVAEALRQLGRRRLLLVELPLPLLRLLRLLRRPRAREQLLRGGVPLDAQLLRVDHLVSLQHLAHEVGHHLLLHLPHLLVAGHVRLLEVAELGLQVLELLRDALVLLRQLHVLVLEVLVGLGVLLLEGGEDVAEAGDLALLLVDGGLVLVVALLQHAVVVLQLLRVQLVGGAHGLEVLLEVLDVSLEADLEDVVLLCVLHALLLQQLLILLHAVLRLLHELLLHPAPPVEHRRQLRLVRVQQLPPLREEALLNFLQLFLERILQVVELLAHVCE